MFEESEETRIVLLVWMLSFERMIRSVLVWGIMR